MLGYLPSIADYSWGLQKGLKKLSPQIPLGFGWIILPWLLSAAQPKLWVFSGEKKKKKEKESLFCNITHFRQNGITRAITGLTTCTLKASQ